MTGRARALAGAAWRRLRRLAALPMGTRVSSRSETWTVGRFYETSGHYRLVNGSGVSYALRQDMKVIERVRRRPKPIPKNKPKKKRG